VHNKQLGFNFLAYGPASLDKDAAILKIIADTSHDYHFYELATTHVAWGDEPGVALVAQKLLASQYKLSSMTPILIIRDAARVLSKTGSRSFSFFGDDFNVEDDEKTVELSSDEILLTKNVVPTFWYVRDPKYLSEEAIGKFMMHLEVMPGTRLDRKNAVDKVADDLKLSATTRQGLSKFVQLGAMQVHTAAGVMQQLHASEDLLLQLVEQSQKALGRDKTEELRTSVTTYSLDLLNIAAKFTPDQVIKALRKKPQATLCFYGMPGTGKTQLAEYIADQLDKPLLVKRASDLLSKWVGDNEKNIAEMFHEAKAEGAILLLDEADSFLRDRSLAKSNWEATMVNELLQQMERFPGIFICASNLFTQLDAAAIRRFTFKFNFQELDDQQRIKMFENETGVRVDETHPQYEQLMMIQHLTPGDFATVKRQANLLDLTLDVDTWLLQLAEEAKAKLAGLITQGHIRGGQPELK
jgi:adenylate kinase family enzyme